MRLIDADALKKIIDREVFGSANRNYINDLIDKAPTIEPKRGEWIVHEARAMVGELGIDFYPAEYVCSCCGFKESMYFIDREPYNYCPNCGTKMVKGEDNGIHK